MCIYVYKHYDIVVLPSKKKVMLAPETIHVMLSIT